MLGQLNMGTSKTCASATFLVLAALLAAMSLNAARAQVTYSQQSGYPQIVCYHLSNANKTKLRLFAKTHNTFWSGTTEKTRLLYIAALKHGVRGVNSVEATHARPHEIGVSEREVIMLAAIVRHDMPLLETYYNSDVKNYFINKMHTTPLYLAAMCNFSDGVEFLLHHGGNPNNNTLAAGGPFNVALWYARSTIPELLLSNGYDITQNRKMCLLSKYMVKHHRVNVTKGVAVKIRGATCPG